MTGRVVFDVSARVMKNAFAMCWSRADSIGETWKQCTAGGRSGEVALRHPAHEQYAGANSQAKMKQHDGYTSKEEHSMDNTRVH